MDDLTTQGAAAAYQAEDAEHVDARADAVVPECFQDEDSERSLNGPPASQRVARARVP